MISSVGITKWMQKTAHRWTKTPRNTQNKDATRSSTHPHLASQLLVWLHRIRLPLLSNNYQATTLLAATWPATLPSLLFPPFFSATYTLFHFVLSLAHLLYVLSLLHTEYCILIHKQTSVIFKVKCHINL